MVLLTTVGLLALSLMNHPNPLSRMYTSPTHQYFLFTRISCPTRTYSLPLTTLSNGLCLSDYSQCRCHMASVLYRTTLHSMEHSLLYSVRSIQRSPLFADVSLSTSLIRLYIPRAPYCLISPSCPHIHISTIHTFYINIYPPLPIIAVIPFFDSCWTILPTQQHGLWRSRSLFVRQRPPTISPSVVTYRLFHFLIPISDVRHPRLQ